MKGKATFIVPEGYDELIKVKHFLMSRDRSYRTVHVKISEEESYPMIMTELDFWEKMFFKISFGAKTEKISVIG